MSIGTGAAIALAVSAGATAGGAAYSAHAQAKASDRAATLQTNSANLGANLQSRSAADQLAFLKEQDARQNAQYLEEQGYTRNYQAQRDAYAKQVLDEQVARREPFRQIGLGALGQLATPIVQRQPSGTLGDVVR